MKNQDKYVLIAVAVVAALVSYAISNAIFYSPKKNIIKVPVVTPISPTFPAVQNDSNYTSFFNNKALDPTQLIQIGGGNTSPFNSTTP